jgi:hypothetical protein
MNGVRPHLASAATTSSAATPEKTANRLVAQLEPLGHTVTLENAA